MVRRSRALHEQRVKRALDYLEENFYEQFVPFKAGVCNYGTGIVPFSERLKGEYRPVSAGSVWGENYGKTWDHAWFHLEVRVPEEWRGRTVVALLNIGAEGCVYDSSGISLQGITAYTAIEPGFYRDRLELLDQACGDENIELWIEASVSLMFGVTMTSAAKANKKKFGYHRAVVEHLNLAVWRKDIWDLYLDIYTLFELSQQLPEKSVRRDRILHALNRAIDILELDSATIAACRGILCPELNKPANASALTAIAVGHAHLDTAWLWPCDETIRKCARSFSTQLSLMEKYPEYVFGASQAQHYDFTRKYYPELFQRIKAKIAEGRWEVQGAMWVEADCNVTGGESLVRQILYGKNYFMDEFGLDIRNLWLPDVFGYSAALPQILKKSGVDYFVTQKISWNQFNKFPHHTFRWLGIDGTGILTHFPPEDTYNSKLNPRGLVYAQNNFQEKAVLDEFLTLYGVGDGGGGPKEEMIEAGRRQESLEGVPKVRFGTAGDFLKNLDERTGVLDSWSGELYLELHRGTLTTQAFNKKMNRKMELNLRELEILYSALPAADYPQQQLDSLWKRVLKNQFHDIIPGSGINRVYSDCREEYAQLLEECQLLENNYATLVSDGAEDWITAINTLSGEYRGEIALPESWRGYRVTDADGNILPYYENSGQAYVLKNIPGLSAVLLHRGTAEQAHCSQRQEEQLPPLVLENAMVYYEFAADGTIAYGYDKESGFAFIPRGKQGNVLKLYGDYPVNWDAWDVDIYYERQPRETIRCTAMRKIINCGVAQQLFLDFEVGTSKICQTVSLFVNSKRLEFSTVVEWQEKHRLLKTEFETAVFSEQAVYEIQYGNIKRNTHRNTSWDMARFEVVGQRYADLSDGNYGVALLNDCKYGHRICDGKIALSLLRSPDYPDPDADMGTHSFTYALLPHGDRLEESSVLSEAAQLNQKAVVITGRAGWLSPCRLIEGLIVVEVIKKAEKSASIIVRLYEPFGRREKIRLSVPPAAVCYKVDIMEWHELQELKNEAGKVSFEVLPYEIVTLKIVI